MTYLATNDVNHRFVNANRKLREERTRWSAADMFLFSLSLTKRKMKSTHVCVFGHWVELEEERTLNDLTYLAEKKDPETITI